MKLTIASILPVICAVCFCNSLCAFDKGGQLQLIENRGQVTDQHGNVRQDIDLKAEQGGVTLYVGSGELHYQWTTVENPKSKIPNPTHKSHNPNSIQKSQIRNSKFQDGFSGAEPGEVVIYRMDVELVGANKGAEAVFEEATGYYENYYLAHTGEDGVQARGYNKVTYKNVYPGIDWVIYTSPNPSEGGERYFDAERSVKSQNIFAPSEGGEKGFGVEQHVTSPLERPGEVLKYDFIVHEGGNVADIRLRYKGATELKIEDGALIATTPFGSITEAMPYSYEAGTGRGVNSSYLLQGNELGFKAGSYNGKLVIDPELNWGTYYGAWALPNKDIWIWGIATDTARCTYAAGDTKLQNMATTGAFQDTVAGYNDAIIVKFDTTGNRVWSTYLGGNSDESITSISCDSANGVYIGGVTRSAGLGTTGTYQPGRPGLGGHAFIAKFNSIGQREWATYYGDSAGSELVSLVADKTGNVYVAGFLSGSTVTNTHTHSYGTAGAYISSRTSQTQFKSFVAKLNANGQRIWGSFLNQTYNLNIVPDMNGNAYVSGNTSVNTYQGYSYATTGTHQQSVAGGSDIFIMKFGSIGQRLWGTLYGGTGDEQVNTIAQYGQSIFIGGASTSTSGIASSGAYVTTYPAGPSRAGYIARFNCNNGKREWGTYLGMELYALGVSGIAITPGGDVFCTATTESTTGVSTPGAHQASIANTRDACLQWISGDGKKRRWGSYYGGSMGVTGISSGSWYDGQNVTCVGKYIHILGSTASSTGIATPNTYQSTLASYHGTYFISRFYLPDTLVYISNSFHDTTVCVGDTIHVPYEVTNNFGANNTFKVLLSNSSGSFSSPQTLATVTSGTAGTISCFIPTSVAAGNGYRIKVVGLFPADTSAENIADIKIGVYPANFTASIAPVPVCTNDTLTLSASSTTAGVTYSWTGPDSYTSASANNTIGRPSLAAAGNYYVAVKNGFCEVKDTFTASVHQAPEQLVASSNSPLCTGDTFKLTSSSSTSGVTYIWSGPANYSMQNVVKPNVSLSDAGTYKLTAILGGCVDTAIVNVAVQQSATVNIVPLTPVDVCKGDSVMFASFINNAGGSPIGVWQVNGVDISGGTLSGFLSKSLTNGDEVRLKITTSTSCPGPVYSNEIGVTVKDRMSPQVTMSASAGPSLFANEPITFTAVATDAGNNPEYQWLRNNQPVGGAIGATWGANANFLNDGDDICVRVKSSYECASPDTATSNCMKLNIRVSVQNIGELNGVKVYPNPVSRRLTIETPLQLSPKGRGYSVVLYDVVGRVVATPQMNSDNKVLLDMSAVPVGNYVLQVMGDDGSRGYYKIQKGNPK